MSDFWDERRVLVTGATGLVGSWLVRSLVDRGAYVVALVRDRDPQSELVRSGVEARISVVNGRLENYEDVERGIVEHEIETVFHLGAQTIVGTAFHTPMPTFEANIRGTWNLLEACRRHSAFVRRVVVASSDKAYGSAKFLPYDETMPPLGRFPYDVSKSCADLLAQSYFHTYKLPVVVARCGNIYGGGDLNWSRIVPGAIRSLLHGAAPVIRSDGTFTRDYVYVEDAVEAYLGMAEAMDRADVQGEAFNFGPAQPYRVREIVDTLRKLTHRCDLEPVVLSNARAEIHDQFLASEKAAKILGWQPRFSLSEGLKLTVDWYRSYFACAA